MKLFRVFFFFFFSWPMTLLLYNCWRERPAGRRWVGCDWSTCRQANSRPAPKRPALLNCKRKKRKKKNQQQLSGVTTSKKWCRFTKLFYLFYSDFFFVLFYQPYKALCICILSFFFSWFCFLKYCFWWIDVFFPFFRFHFGLMMWTDLPLAFYFVYTVGLCQ